MKKGILIVIDIKDDPMGLKHYKLVTMLKNLYYPLGDRENYLLEGEKLDHCLKHIKEEK